MADQPDNQEEPQAGTGAPPEEEELRRRLEEQLSELRVEDVLLQSVASLLNLSARRIAKEDERDLEQAKLGIEAVRAVLGLLSEKDSEAVRNALSELQMLYARHAEQGAEGEQAAGGEHTGTDDQPAGGENAPKDAEAEKARAEARSRLWTPPGN